MARQYGFPGESSSTVRSSSPLLMDVDVHKDSGNLPVSNPSNPCNVDGVIREGTKYYCLRSILQQTDCLNTNVLDCSVTFSVDKNICVTGVQVPTQIAAAMVRAEDHASFIITVSFSLYRSYMTHFSRCRRIISELTLWTPTRRTPRSCTPTSWIATARA